MSINLADKKIRFMAVRIPLAIYRGLLDTNLFLMVHKGHYYMCCTSLDIAIFSYLHANMTKQFDSIPNIDNLKTL